jgi:hypothetical protein
MMMKLKFQLCVGILLLGLIFSGCSTSNPAPETIEPVLEVSTQPSPTQPQPTQSPTPMPTATPELDCIEGGVYVNDLAKETYLSASGETFPICSKIVKEQLVNKNSETVSEITIMIKMPAGFDPEHNDWWWGLYDATGKSAMMSGKVPVCIACHQQQASEDYVFSKEVLAASGK